MLVAAMTSFAHTVWAQVPTEKNLLWKISGGGLSRPSYLFGTFHLLCADNVESSEVLRAKLADTERLVLELDFSDPSLVGQMMQLSAMRGDTSLADLFSEEAYESLTRDFQAVTGMPLQPMARMKPYLLVSMVMMPLLQCEVKGWEQVLMEQATEYGLAVGGLETVGEQMAIFDAIPYGLQAEQLQHSLQHTDSLMRAMDGMVALYKTEDIVKLHEQVRDEPTLLDYTALLLDNRNENWIPAIGEQARQEPTFFAVGAGHLGGEKGVIHLLRQAGYTLTPVEQ